jgi:hypothetical protein
MKILVLHPDNPWTKWLLKRIPGPQRLFAGNYIVSRHWLDETLEPVMIWESPQGETIYLGNVWQN